MKIVGTSEQVRRLATSVRTRFLASPAARNACWFVALWLVGVLAAMLLALPFRLIVGWAVNASS